MTQIAANIDDVIIYKDAYYIVCTKNKINFNCWLTLLNIKTSTYYNIVDNEDYYVLTEKEIKQKFPFLT
jgi:hypothetical protein